MNKKDLEGASPDKDTTPKVAATSQTETSTGISADEIHAWFDGFRDRYADALEYLREH